MLRARLLWINVALRGLMETGIVVGLGYWGYHAAGPGAPAILLAIGVPLVGFGFWGLVDFRWAGAWSEPLRLSEELVISLLAALAWYSSGRHTFGATLAGLTVVHHALVYALGDRLLKGGPAARTRAGEPPIA